MKRMIILLSGALLMLFSIAGWAQTDTSKSEENKKKSWYLTLGMDQKISAFYGNYRYFYEGEYNDRPPWSGQEPQWAWKKRELEIDDLVKWSRFYSTKIDLMVSRNPKLK